MRAAGYRGPNVFAPGAVRRIVRASEGLTRRVNILAGKSLLAAFADNEHGITARHVTRAIRDSEFYHHPMSKTKIGLAAGGVAAGLALGLGLHYLSSPSAPTPVQSAAISAAAAQPAAVASAVPVTEPAGAAAALVQARATPVTVVQTAPGAQAAAAASATTAEPAPIAQSAAVKV